MFVANFSSRTFRFDNSIVRSAVLSLLDKELIFKSESDAYSVYDRFFALWLKHH